MKTIFKTLCIAALVCAGFVFVQAQANVVDDWQLVSYKFSSLNNLPLNGKMITLSVDTKEGTIAGNSGGNRYNGQFKFDDAGRLKVGSIGSTKMMCEGVVMQFESMFTGVLRSADSFSFDTGILTITDVETQNFLRFKRTNKPEIFTWYVNKDLVDCVGVVKTKCLQVRDSKTAEWTNFFGPIDGFEFKKGFYYVIEVERTRRENPAGDASAYIHKLVNVVKKTKKEKEL